MKKEGIDRQDRPLIAEGYKEVSVLFADIVGFTRLTSHITPSELIHTLNQLFSRWDHMCETYKIEKIKTIGDCYMAAGGVPERSVDHARNVMEFAIAMLDSLLEFNAETNNDLRLRIGINTGPVVAGVIGTKKFSFDLWGDAVNVASRMESTGVANRIQVSQSTYDELKDYYVFEERGKLPVKGKGNMIVYLLKGRMDQNRPFLTPPSNVNGKLISRTGISPVPSAVYSPPPAMPVCEEKKVEETIEVVIKSESNSGIESPSEDISEPVSQVSSDNNINVVPEIEIESHQIEADMEKDVVTAVPNKTEVDNVTVSVSKDIELPYKSALKRATNPRTPTRKTSTPAGTGKSVGFTPKKKR